MKTVFPDFIELHEGHLKRIEKIVQLTTYDDKPKENQVIDRIQGAEIITANYYDVTKKIIQSCPSLKYIIVPTVGYEWVDIKAATTAGVKVINCPTHNGHAVAEHTIALMFAISRKIVQANEAIKKGNWTPLKFEGLELSGKTLGIVGHGKIGSQTGELAQGLGMKVLFADSKTSANDLDALIAEVDYLGLNLPLNEHTHHLIDERRLRLMKKTAFFINTARGAIVDQKALLAALKRGDIGGAGLDVFDGESFDEKPIPEIVELCSLENVVATPHIAFNTKETVERLGNELMKNIEACVAGNPMNVVNA